MFLAAVSIPDMAIQVSQIKKVLGFIPNINLMVLARLTKLLKSIADNESVNKMGAPNLAIVFAPSIIALPV